MSPGGQDGQQCSLSKSSKPPPGSDIPEIWVLGARRGGEGDTTQALTQYPPHQEWQLSPLCSAILPLTLGTGWLPSQSISVTDLSGRGPSPKSTSAALAWGRDRRREELGVQLKG